MSHKRWIGLLSSLCLCVSVVQPLGADGPWTTYRGNPQRTGNTDGKAGPGKPEVLWAQKGQEHYVASPVPVGDRLIVSGLSGFNIPSVAALETTAEAPKRVAWSKSVPVLKLPTVSSPALHEGLLIFGDGMHQTDGAVLHGV